MFAVPQNLGMIGREHLLDLVTRWKQSRTLMAAFRVSNVMAAFLNNVLL